MLDYMQMKVDNGGSIEWEKADKPFDKLWDTGNPIWGFPVCFLLWGTRSEIGPKHVLPLGLISQQENIIAMNLPKHNDCKLRNPINGVSNQLLRDLCGAQQLRN